MAAAALVLAPTAVRAEWNEARSAHFTVYSAGRPEQLRHYVDNLERFDAAMRVFYHVPDYGAASSSSRVTIYLVDRSAQVGRLANSDGVAGFYQPRAGGAVAFGSRFGESLDQDDLSAQAVLFHEYAHHFMYTGWPNVAYPPWLVEGFAELNATAAIDRDGNVTLGRPPFYRVYGVFNQSLPLEELLGTQGGVKTSQDKLQALYGRGWLLTHYLLINDHDRTRFVAYVRALGAGKTSVEAGRIAFGDLRQMDAALDHYAGGQVSGFGIKAAMLKVGPVTLRPLTDGEAAVLPAEMKTKRGVSDKDAAAVAALAQQLAAPYPTDAGAQNELAEAEFDAKHYEAADAAAARALAADPKSLHALIYRGRAQLEMARRDKITDPARWKAVRQWFLSANTLDTENAEPLLLYYASFTAADQAPTKNAQDALLYAEQLAPFDDGLRMTAASVLLNRNDPGAARALLMPVGSEPHAGSALPATARKAVAAIDAGHAGEALTILQSPKSETAPPSL